MNRPKTKRITVDDFNYVWEFYNSTNGIHDFFKETGLTEAEVFCAMRIVAQSRFYAGSFCTFERELTRDILYYMKGIKWPPCELFGDKYEYQIILDELFKIS